MSTEQEQLTTHKVGTSISDLLVNTLAYLWAATCGIGGAIGIISLACIGNMAEDYEYVPLTGLLIALGAAVLYVIGGAALMKWDEKRHQDKESAP